MTDKTTIYLLRHSPSHLRTLLQTSLEWLELLTNIACISDEITDQVKNPEQLLEHIVDLKEILG